MGQHKTNSTQDQLSNDGGNNDRFTTHWKHFNNGDASDYAKKNHITFERWATAYVPDSEYESQTLLKHRFPMCVGKPSYADVVQMLPPISSRGHMSYRFKHEIRAQNEPEIRQLLNNFQSWYVQNNLDGLLSERMARMEAENGGPTEVLDETRW